MPAAAASEQLRAIAVRLREAGDGAMRLQLARDLRAGAQPLVTSVKAAAVRQLPKRNGLNQWVARQKVTVSVLTGARTAGVRMLMRAIDAGQTDQGYVRHPVFGDRERWVRQDVPQASGWWTATLTKESPAVTPLLVATLERVAAEIQGV